MLESYVEHEFRAENVECATHDHHCSVIHRSNKTRLSKKKDEDFQNKNAAGKT